MGRGIGGRCLAGLLCLLMAFATGRSNAGQPEGVVPGLVRVVERPELARHFAAAGTTGTMVAFDAAAGSAVVINPERAARSFLPASTFKITNTLIGLEVGAVTDIDGEVFAWDGSRFLIPACDADLTLRAAFRLSCVPVFQQVARRIGVERFTHWLRVLDYGNADVGGAALDRFWIGGDLRITAWQQVGFLERLAAGTLPVSARTLELVREIMVLDRAEGQTLRAKTGWAQAAEPPIGWWVGWVEKGGRRTVFALNMDMDRLDLGPVRLEIGKAILRELGAY